MKERLDDELIQAFTRGEQQAFKAIFEMFFRDIQFFAHQITCNRQEAEDITSATFEKLFKLHASFTSGSNIKAFLYVTSRNQCFDYLRQEKRRKTYAKDFSDTNELDEKITDEEAVVEQELMWLELVERINERIQKLPGQCGRIFKMIYFDDLSVKQVAKELNISPKTVRSQKRRALKLLRMSLLENKLLLLVFFTTCFINP